LPVLMSPTVLPPSAPSLPLDGPRFSLPLAPPITTVSSVISKSASSTWTPRLRRHASSTNCSVSFSMHYQDEGCTVHHYHHLFSNHCIFVYSSIHRRTFGHACHFGAPSSR
jgi:hypothetical protein